MSSILASSTMMALVIVDHDRRPTLSSTTLAVWGKCPETIEMSKSGPLFSFLVVVRTCQILRIRWSFSSFMVS